MSNIIKEFSKEYNLSYKEIAETIGVSESSLRSSVSTNKISKQVKKSLELYKKILILEKELKDVKQIKDLLKSWLK